MEWSMKQNQAEMGLFEKLLASTEIAAKTLTTLPVVQYVN